LAIAWGNSFQLLDGVNAAPVVGVPFENGESGGIVLGKIGMVFQKAG
jgi:hypothetical protein